jgi:DNA-binding NtrC family response regulator
MHDLSKPHVLLVDDDVVLARTLARALTPYFHVDILHDATSVLIAARAGARWDAIACDVCMPDMDGLALRGALAEVDPSLSARVVFVTGTPRLVPEGLRSIEKPLEAGNLRAVLDELARAA